MSTNILPTLYTKGKNRELRQWSVTTERDIIVVTHGVIGGQMVEARRKATPKNVGRANETSGMQQAQIEAVAMWNHKVERKYSQTIEKAQEIVPLPMLAKDFTKAKKITYPVDVQPKLDGVRAIARREGDEVVLISRGGKLWTAVPHINAALKTLLPKDSEFDGEIYLHGKPFQWITSRAKKAHPDSAQLQYHVYDMPTVDGEDSLVWCDRRDTLNRSSIGRYDSPSPILLVPTVFAQEVLVKRLHDNFVKDGYEGAIVRLLDGVYEYGHRSSSLLKLKAFDDAEFTIVGARAGEGIESDLVLWECRNDINSLTFATRPKGTHEDRRWLLQNAGAYYGQPLKVKFFGRTDDGLPRFPIAEGIRVVEDMD